LPFRGQKFNQLLNESKFIAQLSTHESFGCAVVDGALMGCVPLVYNRFALAELVEGFIEAPAFGDLYSIKKVLTNVEMNAHEVAFTSRHFHNKFPYEKRASLMQKYLSDILA